MLDTMRSLSKSFVAKALMILLVISFGFWGVGDILRNRGNSYLVKVGDETISPQQFSADQRNMQQAMADMGIRDIDAKALQTEVLKRLVQQRLVAQWRHDTGLAIDRATLASALGQMGEFKGIDGKFDPKRFTAALRMKQTNEQSYLNQLGEQMGGRAMLLGIDASDAAAPPSLLALTVAAGTQTRDAVVITVPPAPAPAVTDEEVKSYYEQHATEYEQPETRTLEYVTLERVSLEKLAPANATPEAREEAIQEMSSQVEDALAGGSTMGEAIAQAGIHAQSKMLTEMTAEQLAGNKDALLRGVAEQGFQLGEGESSGLVSTTDGHYYMVGVKKIHPAAPKPFERVAAEARQELMKDRVRQATRERVQAMKDALAKGGDWRQAVATAHATARPVANIARPTGGFTGKVEIAGGVSPLLQQAIFEHAVGEVAGPMVRANGEQVVALVTAVLSQPAAQGAADTAIMAQYRTESGTAISNAVFHALANRYPVRVNEAMMRQLEGGNE